MLKGIKFSLFEQNVKKQNVLYKEDLMTDDFQVLPSKTHLHSIKQIWFEKIY